MKYYGIYKITNLLNGKMYIGQHTTEDLDDGYMGSGKIIKQAVKKYGIENFRKEWIMFCEDEEELNYWESVFVDETWVMRSDTYNLQTGGNHWTLSEESRRKMSEARSGNKNPWYGKRRPEEHKRKQSETMKKKYGGGKHPHIGTHRSKETRSKISEARKGLRHTEEWKFKISEMQRG